MEKQKLKNSTKIQATLARAASLKDSNDLKLPVCMGYVDDKLIAVPVIADTLDYSEDKQISGYIEFPEKIERIPAGNIIAEFPAR